MPLSFDSLNVRFLGLRWVLVARVGLRIGLNLRAAGRSFRAPVVVGAASGDAEEACVGVRMFADNERYGGGSRDGDSGELGEGDVDFDVTKRNVGPFDGDLDRERRSCLNAEAGSTRCMCVGEGKCRVPPASPCGEYVPTMRSARGTPRRLNDSCGKIARELWFGDER